MKLPVWADAIPRTEIQADPRLARMEVIRTDASGRNPFFVTVAETDVLLQLAGGAPPVLTGAPDQEITVGDRGAGYGDPLTNKVVELAAMHAAVNLYENEGWICEDVGSRQLGWDITVRRDGQERHVEVKGVGGGRPSILLTRHEYDTARSDAQWELIVVTAALEPLPRIWQYTPEVAHVRSRSIYLQARTRPKCRQRAD